ncbi:MAG: peptidoglycan DD-metalloendopeptidase family protein [Treponema sp.]|nr:peptidoglycan DD-metalloendopeptidase family protein [Treponema sp.]
MRKTVPLCLCVMLFLLGCARNSGQVQVPDADVLQDEMSAAESRRWPEFVLSPPNARPGEPFTVAFSELNSVLRGEMLRANLFDSRGRRLSRASFFMLPGDEQIMVAVMAVPSTAQVGEATVSIETDYATIRELPFVIDGRDFYSETIHLDPVNTDLRTRPDPQRTAESQNIWAILNRTGTEVFFWDTFLPPVSSTRRTSYYGSRRVFQYSDGGSDTSIHAGVDYGVPTGTEVFASAAGRVVLARSRILTGNSVVLEHLPGIYSIYYHLNQIAVSEDSIVEAGALLGHSGATGLATGPHLHWEIRVYGENADPDVFLARPVIDKDDIINKLANYNH